MKFFTWTLRFNDADGNENVKKKKTKGLINQTTTSHVHHTFLNISFPFLHEYDVKMPNFAFYGGRKTERKQIHFSSDVLVAVGSLDLKVPNGSERGRVLNTLFE